MVRKETTEAMSGNVNWYMDDAGKLTVGNSNGRTEDMHYVVSDPEAFWVALVESKRNGHRPLFGHPWLQQWAAERGITVQLDGEYYDSKAKAEADGRKQFARDQMAYMVGIGFSQGSAHRIMKAAGPGQVRAAVEWAYEARDTFARRYEKREYQWQEPQECSESERLSAAVDALDMLLSGLGGTNGFGKDRTLHALRAFGLEFPEDVYFYAGSSSRLFSILIGAREALRVGLPEKRPASVAIAAS